MSQIQKIEDEISKLREKQKNIIEKRKLEIGNLAYKTELLTTDDELIAGALSLLGETIKKGNDKELETFRKAGRPFCRKGKSKKAS